VGDVWWNGVGEVSHGEPCCAPYDHGASTRASTASVWGARRSSPWLDRDRPPSIAPAWALLRWRSWAYSLRGRGGSGPGAGACRGRRPGHGPGVVGFGHRSLRGLTLAVAISPRSTGHTPRCPVPAFHRRVPARGGQRTVCMCVAHGTASCEIPIMWRTGDRYRRDNVSLAWYAT